MKSFRRAIGYACFFILITCGIFVVMLRFTNGMPLPKTTSAGHVNLGVPPTSLFKPEVHHEPKSTCKVVGPSRKINTAPHANRTTVVCDNSVRRIDFANYLSDKLASHPSVEVKTIVDGYKYEVFADKEDLWETDTDALAKITYLEDFIGASRYAIFFDAIFELNDNGKLEVTYREHAASKEILRRMRHYIN